MEFCDYAKRHYLKRFEKEYRGKQWDITVESIIQDLARIKTSNSDLQKTQQVDELWHKDDYWVFIRSNTIGKYVFIVVSHNDGYHSYARSLDKTFAYCRKMDKMV